MLNGVLISPSDILWFGSVANLRNEGLVSEDKASLGSRCNLDSVKISKRTLANKFSGDGM